MLGPDEKINCGDIVRMKKPHPCGGFEWKVLRIGVDFRLECTTCGRTMLVARQDILKRITKIVKKSEDSSC